MNTDLKVIADRLCVHGVRVEPRSGDARGPYGLSWGEPVTTAGSLFSGSGMLDAAVHEVLGVEPAWVVENDPAASKVLAHHWPNVPNYGDITRVNWEDVEPVDVLTAGFPCQDVSSAGKRLGLRRGTSCCPAR